MPYRAKTRRNYNLKRKYPYRKKASLAGKRKMYNSQYRVRTKPTAEVKQVFVRVNSTAALFLANRAPTTFADVSTTGLGIDNYIVMGAANPGAPTLNDATVLPCDLTAALLQGSAANQRIGNKVKLTRIMGKIHANNVIAACGCLTVHMILDTAPEATNNLAYTEIFPIPYAANSLGYQSSFNTIPKVYNASRYRLLKTWNIAPKEGANNVEHPITVDIKTNLDVRYRNGQAGQPSTTSQNRLILLYQYDVAQAWEVVAHLSLLYVDS